MSGSTASNRVYLLEDSLNNIQILNNSFVSNFLGQHYNRKNTLITKIIKKKDEKAYIKMVRKTMNFHFF